METQIKNTIVPTCFGTTSNVEECQGCSVIKECSNSYKEANSKW